MSTIDNQTQEKYPRGLLSWTGGRQGGVCKPFREDSGRPAGHIETPLSRRLEEWVEGISAPDGSASPRSIFLVGGPGNGKTDAIERCIKSLGKKLGADERLTSRFADQYDVKPPKFVPRRVVVDLNDLGLDLPEHLQCKLVLVQDASETAPGTTAGELFLDDLVEISQSKNEDIYLCCVNRGILAAASSQARKNNRVVELPLVEAITRAVTPSAKPTSCWPLEGFAETAVWPMDIESLVDKREGVEEPTVAHKIFEVALDASKWDAPCSSADQCPFCLNRKLLSDSKNLDNLISILRFYELASGKRWTFRDLFSLVPYLLVGDVAELKLEGKELRPCDWSKEQLKLVSSNKDSGDASCAPFLLVSRLYYHRLFPLWPSLDRGEYRKAKQMVLKDKRLGIAEAKNLFRFLVRSKRNALTASGEVPSTIRGNFSSVLEPARASGDQSVFTRKGSDVLVRDIEDRFNLSVDEGLKYITRKVTKLERNVFKRLNKADADLVEDNFKKRHWSQVALLKKGVRQFASRLAKRSLCVQAGITADSEFLNKYADLALSADAMNDARKQLAGLLNEKNNSFRAGLATTFGQPLAKPELDVALVVQEKVLVKSNRISGDGNARPDAAVQFLSVEGFEIPLTFQLYKALFRLGDGMNIASLGTEVFSFLDRVKAMVAGRMVRRSSLRDEESYIQVGTNKSVIMIESCGYTLKKIE